MDAFLAQAVASSGLWTTWENMTPIWKFGLIIGWFLIGIWLAWLYCSRWTRRHLQLLSEQEKLKRQWDTLQNQRTAAFRSSQSQ